MKFDHVALAGCIRYSRRAAAYDVVKSNGLARFASPGGCLVVWGLTQRANGVSNAFSTQGLVKQKKPKALEQTKQACEQGIQAMLRSVPAAQETRSTQHHPTPSCSNRHCCSSAANTARPTPRGLCNLASPREKTTASNMQPGIVTAAYM